MDIKEKFLKIVSKAESNGFSFRNDSQIDDLEYIGMGRFKTYLTITHPQEGEEGEIEEKTTFVFNITEMVFNHNFAKAFFGTHEICKSCGHTLKGEDWKNNKCTGCESSLDDGATEAWKKNLQELVLEEDLFEYLIKHVG